MKTTIDMARKAGFAIDVSSDPNSPPSLWAAGHADRFKAFEALVRADERTQPATCTWTKSADPHAPDTFDATCGAVWTFTDGGPTDNDMHFCPKCGNKVVEGGAA